jgi:hypothetical protein
MRNLKGVLSYLSLFLDPLLSPRRIHGTQDLENRKARAFKYSPRTGYRELYERIHAEHSHLYNECYASYMDGIENGIKRDPKRFFDFANYKHKTVGYPSSMRYDLFESVYYVDTCDSVTENVSGPSDGCGLSGFVKLYADGLKSPLLHIFNF